MSDRVHCPTCEGGPALRALSPQQWRKPLLRCDTCLGVLMSSGSVAVVSTRFHASHYVMSQGHGRHICRSCGAIFDRWRERCRTCLKEQTIGCVRCLMPMQCVEVAGVALDLCRQCRLVWFDRGELGLLTLHHAAELQRQLTLGSAAGVALELAAPALEAPDSLHVAGALARVSADLATSAATEASVAAVVEGAMSAGDVAVEIAGGALDVILSLFDAL